jgi:hypothetical protein
VVSKCHDLDAGCAISQVIGDCRTRRQKKVSGCSQSLKGTKYLAPLVQEPPGGQSSIGNDVPMNTSAQ